jgi:hypothetical protein
MYLFGSNTLLGINWNNDPGTMSFSGQLNIETSHSTTATSNAFAWRAGPMKSVRPNSRPIGFRMCLPIARFLLINPDCYLFKTGISNYGTATVYT